MGGGDGGTVEVGGSDGGRWPWTTFYRYDGRALNISNILPLL